MGIGRAEGRVAVEGGVVGGHAGAVAEAQQVEGPGAVDSSVPLGPTCVSSCQRHEARYSLLKHWSLRTSLPACPG